MCWYDGVRGVAGVAMVCGAIACGGSTKSNGAGNGDGDETGGSSPVGSGGGNGTGGSGTGEEECSRSLEDFCAWKERDPRSQFRCEASSYDDVFELAQTWPLDCEVFAPEVGQTSWSYSYGSCGGEGRFISQLRASVSETYYFNSDGELVGVYLGNATGDTPCSYGTLPCRIDVIEFETCPLGGGGAGGGDK